MESQFSHYGEQCAGLDLLLEFDPYICRPNSFGWTIGTRTEIHISDMWKLWYIGDGEVLV